MNNTMKLYMVHCDTGSEVIYWDNIAWFTTRRAAEAYARNELFYVEEGSNTDEWIINNKLDVDFEPWFSFETREKAEAAIGDVLEKGRELVAIQRIDVRLGDLPAPSIDEPVVLSEGQLRWIESTIEDMCGLHPDEMVQRMAADVGWQEELPALIASHRTLQRQLREARESLQFYASVGTYGIECDGTNCYYAFEPPIDTDKGQRARAVLNQPHAIDHLSNG